MQEEPTLQTGQEVWKSAEPKRKSPLSNYLKHCHPHNHYIHHNAQKNIKEYISKTAGQEVWKSAEP